MITAEPGARSAMAICQCDTCGTIASLPCPLEKLSHHKGHGGSPDRTINEGMARKKLVQRGWRVERKTIHCPNCQQAQKTQPAIKDFAEMAIPNHPPTNIAPPGLISLGTELRQPTREQKRQIVDMLTAVYDTKAQRYAGAETDLTVADAIGGGILFGWVAQIREDLFGPAGGNAEIDALREDLLKLVETYGAQLAKVNAALIEGKRIFEQASQDRNALSKLADQVNTMATRLDRICKSLGPKGAV